MKKDDIEKLFSSLEDFSKVPPDELWKGIEEKLVAPKKKKRTPFWWPIAASLVVGLGLLATFYFNSDEGNSLKNIPSSSEKGVVNQSRGINAVRDGDNHVIKESEQKENKQNKEESILNGVVTNKDRKDKKVATPSLISSTDKKQISKSTNDLQETIYNRKSSVLANENHTLVESEVNEDLLNKTTTETKNITGKAIADTSTKEKLETVNIEENALAVLAKEQQKKEKTNTVADKWSLQVFAGVNSSQNVKNQKSLGNTIESQKGYSYGIKTNYKLNRKWAVATGLKISELGQQLANVSYVNSAQSLVTTSRAPFSGSKEKGSISTNSNYVFIENAHDNSKNALTNSFYETGNLSQKVQYLQVPMEVSYVLLNKGKTQLNLNTGGFVGKVISNEVLLDDSSIGKNSDVNEVIFGSVLSSSLQYELFKKTKVFVEPGMNYYTKPVENQNFNQFQLLFNFGLNVSF